MIKKALSFVVASGLGIASAVSLAVAPAVTAVASAAAVVAKPAMTLVAFAAASSAHAALTMPTVDVDGDLSTVVTWALALMGAIFLGKLGIPLAKWAFNAVRGFLGR